MSELFDYKMLSQIRNRAVSQSEDTMFLRRSSISRLLDRLYDVKRDFSSILEIGSFNGNLADELFSMSPAKYANNYKLYQMDLSDELGVFSHPSAIYSKSVDMHPPQQTELFDLILSSQFFQWVNDLPGMLAQCRRNLKPDGLLLANFFGGRTLQELRACLIQAETELSGGAYPRCIPMVDIKAAGALLQRAGFALPVSDADLIEVTYSSIYALMSDLKLMGETNTLIERSKQFTSARLFERAGELYLENFVTEEGRIIASFELITLTGWVPDETQQKPLRPGSAKQSLAAFVASDNQLSSSAEVAKVNLADEK